MVLHVINNAIGAIVFMDKLEIQNLSSVYLYTSTYIYEVNYILYRMMMVYRHWKSLIISNHAIFIYRQSKRQIEQQCRGPEKSKNGCGERWFAFEWTQRDSSADVLQA